MPSTRGLLIGGTGVGKSTLAKQLLLIWIQTPKRRLVIFDSKPRWKGERLLNGTSAKGLYRGWKHGEIFPGSIVIRSVNEFIAAWKMYPNFPLIVQEEEDMNVHAQCAKIAYEYAKRSEEDVMLYVDETMDHFTESARPRSKFGGIWARVARSGRELGIGALFATQRSRMIPVQIMEEMSYLFLYQLDYEEDMARMRAMGIPRNMHPPNRVHLFYYWRKSNRRKIWGPYKLKVS